MRAELKRLASQLSNNKDFREVYLCAYKNDTQCIGLYGALRQFIKIYNSTNVTIEEVKTCTTKEYDPFEFLSFIEGLDLAEFRVKGEATNIPYYQLHNLYIDARQIEIAYINHLNRK